MTAYDMRISDWSSDVCSSDLASPGVCRRAGGGAFIGRPDKPGRRADAVAAAVRQGTLAGPGADIRPGAVHPGADPHDLGRHGASVRYPGRIVGVPAREAAIRTPH